MIPYQVTASTTMKAPAERIFGMIADYREGHPRILPKRYFTSLEVEEGGRGAGTVIRFQMKVLGQTRAFRAAITEPVPGRVLTETDLDSGLTTTFSVEPLQAAAHARVRITTEGRTQKGGLAGRVERFLTTALLRRIYAEELILLDRLTAPKD